MPDNAATWETLQTLFHLVEQTAPPDRKQVLSAHCNDPEMCQRVMAMVRGVGLDDEQSAPDVSAVPVRIGPYSLIRLIGAGGIGSVYLVERVRGGAPQRVALKVLSPHAAGAAFVERFHREQHILGSLDHPNITRMLDAGLSDSGQPYLVMEYVDGDHLDAYCDAHKLGIRERIEIFRQVCDAVAYAHRNLIVHLDLKPSNILVNAEGTVKLLDFGTSKLIQPDSFLTTTVLATPAYASPEQLRNEPVTTACDIYSLGAVLSDLLAGRPPAKTISAAAVFERAISQAEPERLTATLSAAVAEARGISEARLRQVLSGDLETITAKCLRPRAKDRYASVDALAGDLQRYLDGRAVLARRQTSLYRIAKFIKRNHSAVIASAIAIVLLVTSLAYAGWRQQQAVRQGQRALQMQTFMYRLFKLANSNYTGKPAATVPEFLRLGVKILPDYIRDPADLRQAQLGLAESMYENGDLESAQKVFLEVKASAEAAKDLPAEAEAEAFGGNVAFLQGQLDQGRALTAHALELSRGRGIPPAVKVWSEIFYAWNRENNGFRDDGNVALLRAAVKDAQNNHLSARETADALFNLGSDLGLRGQTPEAQQLFERALHVYELDPAALCERSEVQGELAWLHQMNGDLSGSLPLYQRAYDGYASCSGPESRGALTQQEFLCGALVKTGRPAEALAMMEKAMPVWRKLEGNSPDLAEPLNFLILSELATGHFAAAEQRAQEMVAVQTGKVEPSDRRFGVSHMLWARALAGQNRWQEALPHAEIADRLLARNAISVGAKQAAAEAHQLLQDVQVHLKTD
jgi:serine/threonine-protein kinase